MNPKEIENAILNFSLYKTDKNNLTISDNDLNIIIRLINKDNLHAELSFIVWKDEPGRLTFFINDAEILDNNDEISTNINYIDTIISNEIIMTEEFCKDNLIKRYYDFYHNINNELQKVRQYSVNKFSLFCKLDKKITIFKPW